MPHTNRILARPPVFACAATPGGLDAAWVNVAGELDITTAPQLERTLRETQQLAHLTVLDLRDLAFMDCAGVHTIVEVSLRAQKPAARWCAAAETPAASTPATPTPAPTAPTAEAPAPAPAETAPEVKAGGVRAPVAPVGW